MATLDVEQTGQPGSLANARLPGRPDEDHLLISVTRLRLASPRFLGGFMWLVVGSGRQARRAPGFRGMRILADWRLTYWTATAWTDAASMKAYRGSGAHRAAMRRLADWCDEASVTRWTGSMNSMRDWSGAHGRMLAEGSPSHVTHPSAQQAAQSWPPPRLRPLVELIVQPRR